jgi:hypothetical protein
MPAVNIHVLTAHDHIDETDVIIRKVAFVYQYGSYILWIHAYQHLHTKVTRLWCQPYDIHETNLSNTRCLYLP